MIALKELVNSQKLKLFVVASMATAIISCSSEDDAGSVIDNSGSLEITFDNKVGSSELVLNSATYTNSSGENYAVSELKYIISNLVLIDIEGNEFVYPTAESYFLINEENESSLQLELTDIETGEYQAVRFGFGIDQSNYPLNGVDNFVPQAEEEGMLWSWSAGYIFLKFEGLYSLQTPPSEPFLYHVGSHGTNLDNYKEIELQLPETLVINSETQSELVLKTDIAKIFDAAFTMSLEAVSSVQVDPANSPKIAENFSRAFSVLEVNN